jgi:two-component system sensor histidine kinase UhpB
MPPELETTFFRIAQEALTNVLRHAQARNLHIRLERTESHVQLEIEDDGVGMHWDSVKLQATEGSSFGVLGMTERAALVGGVLSVWSEPELGCRITFLCPMVFVPTTKDHD